MASIYEGVKSLDEARAVELGTEFFEGVARSQGAFDCVIAGCTELPKLIELLQARSTPTVRAFLSRATILDPLEAALDVATMGVDSTRAH